MHAPAGKGDEDERGEASDLVLVVQEAPNGRYLRRGNDLITKVRGAGACPSSYCAPHPTPHPPYPATHISPLPPGPRAAPPFGLCLPLPVGCCQAIIPLSTAIGGGTIHLTQLDGRRVRGAASGGAGPSPARHKGAYVCGFMSLHVLHARASCVCGGRGGGSLSGEGWLAGGLSVLVREGGGALALPHPGETHTHMGRRRACSGASSGMLLVPSPPRAHVLRRCGRAQVPLELSNIVTPDTELIIIGEGMPITRKAAAVAAAGGVRQPGAEERQERGNMVVQFKVEFPKQLPAETRQQVKALLEPPPAPAAT